jgi:hypothetical protein
MGDGPRRVYAGAEAKRVVERVAGSDAETTLKPTSKAGAGAAKNL